MARPLVQIEGARQLRATLGQSADGLEDLKTANARAAAVAADETRRRAPRGETGRLVGSVRSSGTKTAGYVRAGGARVPYPGVQEWGYRSGRPIKGQHYMTDAAKAAEPRWLPAYERELNDALKKIKGK